MEGWITLNRSLLDHELWQDEPFTRGQAWVDLLLLANHEPRKTLIGGDVVELEIGSYVTTIRRLSERWFRSIEWVTKYLRLLESENMIQTKVVGKGRQARTILLLVNYTVYQFVANAKPNAEQNANRSQTDQLANAKRTQDGGKGVIDNNIYNTYNQQRNKGKREKEVSPSILTDTTPKGGDNYVDYESEFNELWILYPKKHGKQNALRDYIKARKSGVDRKTIEDGLSAYIKYCERTNRYFKDGSTWFHQHSWDDDYEDDLSEVDKPSFSITEYARQMREEGYL